METRGREGRKEERRIKKIQEVRKEEKDDSHGGSEVEKGRAPREKREMIT